MQVRRTSTPPKTSSVSTAKTTSSAPRTGRTPQGRTVQRASSPPATSARSVLQRATTTLKQGASSLKNQLSRAWQKTTSAVSSTFQKAQTAIQTRAKSAAPPPPMATSVNPGSNASTPRPSRRSETPAAPHRATQHFTLARPQSSVKSATAGTASSSRPPISSTNPNRSTKSSAIPSQTTSKTGSSRLLDLSGTKNVLQQAASNIKQQFQKYEQLGRSALSQIQDFRSNPQQTLKKLSQVVQQSVRQAPQIMQQTAQSVQKKIQQVAQNIPQPIQQAVQNVQEKVQHVVDNVQQKAQHVVDNVQEKVQSFLDDPKPALRILGGATVAYKEIKDGFDWGKDLFHAFRGGAPKLLPGKNGKTYFGISKKNPFGFSPGRYSSSLGALTKNVLKDSFTVAAARTQAFWATAENIYKYAKSDKPLDKTDFATDVLFDTAEGLVEGAITNVARVATTAAIINSSASIGGMIGTAIPIPVVGTVAGIAVGTAVGWAAGKIIDWGMEKSQLKNKAKGWLNAW